MKHRLFSSIVSAIVTSSAALALATVACSGASSSDTQGDTQTDQPTDQPTDQHSSEHVNQAKSNLQRDTHPHVSSADMRTVVDGANQFAFELFQHAVGSSTHNEMLSPLSVTTALAMAYAGANGPAEGEMARVLHFSLPQQRLHPAFNQLDLALTAAAKKAGNTLEVANAIWTNKNETVQQGFLDTLAVNYGAGVNLIDLCSDQGYQIINRWTSEHTHGKIPKLFDGPLTDARLVLTNAVYFNAKWETSFEKSETLPRAFHLLDGSVTNVPTMSLTVDEMRRYVQDDGLEAVEIPYAGLNMSFVAVIPPQGKFVSYKSSFQSSTLENIRSQLSMGPTSLHLPKYRFSAAYSLSRTLKGMGMRLAFTQGAGAFTKMIDDPRIHIMDVVHKTFVDVAEDGTEAAGSTGVSMGMDSGIGPEEPEPTVEIWVDRPFLFAIVDYETGMVLFLGQVTSPSAE